MDTKYNGGPAFPVTLPAGERYTGHAPFDGMTLRDYFAAKAMQSFIDSGWEGFGETVADAAYRMADDMLTERAK